ncbi:MAG TPA: heparinase II/III family protein, partial [Terriglobales bacterium]|nr:heparinase II/III family protein [Terriglobales bacterium]
MKQSELLLITPAGSGPASNNLAEVNSVPQPKCSRSERTLQLVTFGVVAALLFAIWYPELKFWREPIAPLNAADVEVARGDNNRVVLDEISRWSLTYEIAGTDALQRADELLAGVLVNRWGNQVRVSPTFDRRDLEIPGSELAIAALAVPEIYIAAYRRTDKDQYLIAARDYISNFEAVDRSAWLPRGLLWNDHAVAARLVVLCEFWHVYRDWPGYDPRTAARVLSLVERSAAFSADSRHFTASTNHGIMQNLALWHYCLTFPRLAARGHRAELAYQRLQAQMRFYINDEGAILEHSAGYHAFGITLLSRILRCATLLGFEIPRDWWKKYEAALQLHAVLRRPDGSLPAIGDTTAGPDPLGPQIAEIGSDSSVRSVSTSSKWPAPQVSSSVLPVAGMATWWNGFGTSPDLAQTMATWSMFPSEAHKHADEMSVLFWARGYDWWT